MSEEPKKVIYEDGLVFVWIDYWDRPCFRYTIKGRSYILKDIGEKKLYTSTSLGEPNYPSQIDVPDNWAGKSRWENK